MQWYEAVNKLATNGTPCVVVTVIGARGSTPRDSGTKMVVCSEQSYCTIGGGHLELKAIDIARQMLRENCTEQKVEHFPLGAKLGQCCGGGVTLLFEYLAGIGLNIALFGAGHVGRALAGILQELPCKLHWVDNRADEFPEITASNIVKTVIDEPCDVVSMMPAASYFIVMTHQHTLDFAITEAILKRNDARYVGLIGSNTKWRQFQMRFEHRQYPPEFYSAVRCPAGLQAVPGKSPIEVAVSIAAEIIADYNQNKSDKPIQQGISWKMLKKYLTTPTQSTQEVKK